MTELNITIAKRIKEIRHKNDLSLDALSSLTGVSKSMLSQIERGEANPTVNVLWKIANGLKTSYSSLLVRQSEVEVINVDDPILADNGKYKLYPVFPFDPNIGMEIYRVEMLPGCLLEAEAHKGKVVEHVTVFTGELGLSVGTEDLTVTSGKAVKFTANQPHAYQNHLDEVCTFSLVITYLN